MFTANLKALTQFAAEKPTMEVGTLPRQTIELACGRVSYLRHGKGRPLLLVHGIPTSCRLWEPLLGALGEHYDCIVPDLLGLGRSQPHADADLSSPGQAAMLEQLLDALGLDQVFAVFHDQGGSHGQQFLKRYGERVKAVILTDVVCYDNWMVPVIGLTMWLGRMRLLPVLAKLHLLQFLLDSYSLPRTIVRGRFSRALRDDWYWAFNQGGRPLADWIRYTLAQSNRWTLDAVPTLQSWTKPARVVWAAHDQYLPVSWGAKLAREIPGADDHPVLLPFAGHFWQAEVPQSGAKAFRDFFDELP